MQCNNFKIKIGDRIKYYDGLDDCYKYGFISNINSTNKIRFLIDDLDFSDNSNLDFSDNSNLDRELLRAFGYGLLLEEHQLILLKIPDYFYE